MSGFVSRKWKKGEKEYRGKEGQRKKKKYHLLDALPECTMVAWGDMEKKEEDLKGRWAHFGGFVNSHIGPRGSRAQGNLPLPPL